LPHYFGICRPRRSEATKSIFMSHFAVNVERQAFVGGQKGRMIDRGGEGKGVSPNGNAVSSPVRCATYIKYASKIDDDAFLTIREEFLCHAFDKIRQGDQTDRLTDGMTTD